MSVDGAGGGPIPDELLYDPDELARIDGWSATETEAEAGTSIARLARTRASGAVVAAMMTRLGEILEGRPVGDEVAVVQEQDDDEIAAMSRTVQPGSSAPSRAGVTGPGSGADDQD